MTSIRASAGSRDRTRLDPFETEILTYLVGWLQYDHPPEDEVLPRFGMSSDGMYERALNIVQCHAKSVLLADDQVLVAKVVELLKRRGHHIATKPSVLHADTAQKHGRALARRPARLPVLSLLSATQTGGRPMSTPSGQWDWQLLATCRGEPAETFYPPDGERGQTRAAREERAKVICRQCPVLLVCRQHALSTGEPYGIWGAMSPAERARLQPQPSTDPLANHRHRNRTKG
jgi:WhiB family transcriptional regulator, redox-sensing transcriptional regulator